MEKTALLRIVYETKVHNNKEYSFRYFIQQCRMMMRKFLLLQDEADRAPPVPVKISKVTMTARKRDLGGKAYHFTSENDSYATSVPKWIQCMKAHHCCAWTRS